MSRSPLIEAHRGDSANAPENTLAAFERAIAIGVPWIELDVHPSADGELVVIHDDTVDRTTDGSGEVSDLSLAELRVLDAGAKFSPAFAGQRVPTLIEVMELVAPTATKLNVEIKASPAGVKVGKAVAQLVRGPGFGKQHEYVISSFDLPCLLEVREADADIALALIGDMDEILPVAARYDLPWVHCNQKTATPGSIQRAKALGKRINVWTVDDTQQARRWAALGVDKICTNRPADLLADWARSKR